MLFKPIVLNHVCAFKSSVGSLWLGNREEDLQPGTQHFRTMMSRIQEDLTGLFHI